MSDNEPQETPVEVSPEQKLKAVTTILPVLSGREHLAVTGSLAMKIMEKQTDGEVVLTPSDMAGINDMDVVSTGEKLDDIRLSSEAVTEATGFLIDVDYATPNCIYPWSGVRDLAVTEVAVRTESDDLGSTRHVEVTTPEFNLLNVVTSDVSEDYPAEKLIRKTLDLQRHPAFSKERFRELATNEISAKYAMNEGTFELWKRTILENYDWASMESEFDVIHSLVDQARFFNAVKTADDLRGLDYSEVRRVSDLEKFLAEMDQEEV